ncbi:MAG: hypothetical protein GDA48_27200 [Hormoscilla sp. GM102CHS1]|nr:hypothetical protein [Hormoscilla sp. GM102CHS1]
MMETYEEAARRTKFRIVLPATSTENGYNGRSGKWKIALRRVFQSVAIDSEERLIMLIKSPGREITQLDKEEFIGYMKAAQGVIPFGMMVDKEEIQIYDLDIANLYEPICTLKVIEVLCRYDPEIGNKQKSPYYLDASYVVGKVESWLNDLADRWKSEIPPATEQMEAIGLLPLLVGGQTKSDVEMRIDILHRN